MYCSVCSGESLLQSPNNAKAIDFYCQSCTSTYQLKAGAGGIAKRIMDGEYTTMMTALQWGTRPNLLVMHYTHNWAVRDLLLIPSFFFTPSVIQQRKPLGAMARRAGWTGCNILLDQIAPEGKLSLVGGGVPVDPRLVRSQYQRIKPLAAIPSDVRGWTLDVLKIVHEMDSKVFSLADVYVYEDRISHMHPENNNVRAKIRQQLQKLRDLGFLRFLSLGRYELLEMAT
jgi:type II restriction enzyme